MVLIFGWGHGPVEDRGEIAPVRCPNCNNDVFLHHVRSTKRVSLFFVPVMPYGTDEYLVCPVCGHGLQVAPGHQSAVMGMRAATSAFRAGSLTEADYRARSDGFLRTMGVTLPTGSATAGAGGSALEPDGSPVEAPLADRLADLARLHTDGVLTDAEFHAAKRHLLER